MRLAEYRIEIDTRHNGDVWYIPQVRFMRQWPFELKTYSKWMNIYRCPHGGYEYDESYQVAYRVKDDAYSAIKGFMEGRSKYLGKFTKTTEYIYLSGL